MVQLINTTIVCLILGVVFPPFAVLSLVTLWLVLLWQQGLYGYYFVSKSTSEAEQHKVCSELNQMPVHLLISCAWTVLPLPILFYGLLLFDTLGNSAGFPVAMAAPFTFFALCVMTWLGFWLWRVRSREDLALQAEKEHASIDGVELRKSNV